MAEQAQFADRLFARVLRHHRAHDDEAGNDDPGVHPGQQSIAGSRGRFAI